MEKNEIHFRTRRNTKKAERMLLVLKSLSIKSLKKLKKRFMESEIKFLMSWKMTLKCRTTSLKNSNKSSWDHIIFLSHVLIWVMQVEWMNWRNFISRLIGRYIFLFLQWVYGMFWRKLSHSTTSIKKKNSFRSSRMRYIDRVNS